MGSRVLAPPALVALIVAVALAGCGSSSNTPTVVTTVTQASGSGTAAQQASAGGGAVATVDQTPITKASFEHWLSVTAAVSHSTAHSQAARTALKDQVLGFLITSQWVLGEATHLGISVSDAEAGQRLHQITAKQFPKASELKKYLASIGESEADLLLRVKVELLEAKISRAVTAGKTASTEVHALLNAFQNGFYARWKRRTSCRPGYVMEDCKQSKLTPHPPAASSSSASTSSSSSSTQTSSGAASSSANGEISSPPGSMTLSSPAFGLNGAIPAQYTCDGADISPPFAWQNLPAHTVELVLFIIDDSSVGKEGGIRWVVAGIDPSLSGIAAGSLPPGAVVGLNGAGKASYGGICPTTKGKPATIEFVLWALSKKIPLSSGFIPDIAEHDYSHSELGSAITYATAEVR